jgi:magnesium chelatase subunit I
MRITRQEASISPLAEGVFVPDFLYRVMENIAFQARASEFVDQKSGVSARMGISIFESVVAGAERRRLLRGDKQTSLRVSDLYDAVQAINGKIEMVYEGEQEGPYNVAMSLIIQSIRETFVHFYPNQGKKVKAGKTSAADPFDALVEWFNSGNLALLKSDASDKEYRKFLDAIPFLKKSAGKVFGEAGEETLYAGMEFILHGLAAVSRINKSDADNGFEFKDLLSGMMNSGRNTDEAYEGGFYEEE